MKPHHLLLLGLLLTGCDKRYKTMEQEFSRCLQQSELLLDGIEARYNTCTPSGQAEVLCDRCRRDGTFTRLDSLAERQHLLLESMVTKCPGRFRQRLSEHIVRKIQTDSRIRMALMPYPYTPPPCRPR